MAKIKNPVLFSTYFGIAKTDLQIQGAFDPALNVDSPLFLDPFLFDRSSAKEVVDSSSNGMNSYFAQLIKLLQNSARLEDVCWRQARRMLCFSEIRWTCLGYGSTSTHGSGFGRGLTERILRTAKEIIDIGIRDPELFLILPLIEEDIGPDRISDMLTHIIMPDLINFTQRVCNSLGIPLIAFGRDHIKLPQNPSDSGPILLVPSDILRHLPIALDYSEIGDVVSHNSALRARVNQMIGEIWQAKTLKDKARLRFRALSSKQAFETLLQTIQAANGKPYDCARDPEGIILWKKFLDIASKIPLKLPTQGHPNQKYLCDIALKIIYQFKTLIELKGLWKELWVDGTHRNEKSVQRLFFAVADSYCKANHLDITPEADSGAGPVDFKFSYGYNYRVLVEIKLSTNPKLVAGYEKQLVAYKNAESTCIAFYLVIDVGGMGKKDQKLLDVKNTINGNIEQISDIVFVDGKKQKSASKL